MTWLWFLLLNGNICSCGFLESNQCPLGVKLNTEAPSAWRMSCTELKIARFPKENEMNRAMMNHKEFKDLKSPQIELSSGQVYTVEPNKLISKGYIGLTKMQRDQADLALDQVYSNEPLYNLFFKSFWHHSE